MLGLLSESCQACRGTSAWMTLKWLLLPSTSRHWAMDYWLLLLSINLATFYNVSSTRRLHLSLFGGLTSWRISPPLPWLPTTPTNHPYVKTCGIDENYLKWWEIQLATRWRVHKLKYIPLITVQQWRNAWKQLHAFLRYNFLN